MSTFGPEYPKIQTLFKRDEKGIIMDDTFTTDEFKYLASSVWRWTEKIDGTNIRLHYDGESITVGGRTDNAQIPGRLMYALGQFNNPDKWNEVFPLDPSDARLKLKLDNIFNLKADPRDVTLYGEGYGAGIQKGGGNYRPDTGFILFDVRIGDMWLKPEDVAEIAGKLGIDTVPVVGHFTMLEAIDRARVWGIDSAFPGVQAEGLVGTPLVGLRDRRGARIIAKIKVVDFEALRKHITRSLSVAA